MAVDYQKVFRIEMPEAYQRLLLDCLIGDQTLFTRNDSILLTWELLEPVLEAWQDREQPLFTYPSGTSVVEPAENLIKKEGRSWTAL